jgi:hypothetical protein
MKYLQENQPIPDSVTRTFEERGQLLEDRFARELGQRHDQAAKEQARADAQATRAAEQAAKEQAQAQIDAAEDVARAWQRSTQVRDRLGRDLTAAQRELTGAQRAQFAETVAALPGLEQERQRVAKLPWADPVRMLELQHELASLRDEAGSILKDDRRKAADERVVAAQARVDQLATDFEKAEAHAHALTEKVKELGGALKDLQTQPGFAAKLSQDLADTLEFLSARSP